MGVLNNRLGVDFGEHDPLVHSVFSSSLDEGGGTPPPDERRMITEGGIYMITEGTLSYMITE